MGTFAKKIVVVISIAIFVFLGCAIYVAIVRRQEAAKRAQLEGFNIKKITRMIPIVGKVMATAVKMITTVPKRVAMLIKSLKLVGRGIWSELGAVGSTAAIFAKDAGTIAKCGAHLVSNLPNCWMFYLLDFTANTLYGIFVDLPVFCIKWVLGVDISPAINIFFDTLEFGDEMVHDATGFHVIHYPESVSKMCYHCKLPDSGTIGKVKQLFRRPTKDITDAGHMFVKVFTG
jgi:hypothetical protein